VSDYTTGDDCIWPHCSTIATCPCCRKDAEIERLEAEIDRFCERACNAENKLSDAQAEIERALKHCAIARLCSSCEEALGGE
jgi:hypothetical protein